MMHLDPCRLLPAWAWADVGKLAAVQGAWQLAHLIPGLRWALSLAGVYIGAVLRYYPGFFVFLGKN